MKREMLKKMMNAKIGAIANAIVDVTVLSGRNGNGFYLTVEIEGNATKAVENLKSFFGKNFDGAEYDEELGYTYVGLEIA